MRKITLLTILIFIISIGYSQIQSVEWGIGFGGPKTDGSTSIAVDKYKNFYIAGRFVDTVDFDPGPGIFTLASNGSSDIFISKFDSTGNFLWTKQIGGNGSDGVSSIIIDSANQILVSGSFSDTVDFDPGIGVYEINTESDSSYSNKYTVKLDEDGNFIFMKKVGGRLHLDKFQNIFLYGGFSGTVDFDPSPLGVYNLSASMNNYGTVDIFVSKLDPDFNFQWAFKYSSYLDDRITGVQTDSIGNVYVAGGLRSTFDFDPGPGIYNLQAAYEGASNTFYDIFMAKYDPTGNFIWANRVGSRAHDYPHDFTMDEDANMYLVGTFDNPTNGQIDFDPGPDSTFLRFIDGHYFHAKYNSDGEFIWAHATKAESYAVACGKDNRLYMAGYYSNFYGNPLDFDPGPGIYPMSIDASFDLFLSVFDKEGNFQEAKRLGGEAKETVFEMLVDPDENVYLCGIYEYGSTNLGEGQDSINFSNKGFADIFALKLGKPHGVSGKIFRDLDQNCVKDNIEPGLAAVSITIDPGNIQLTSDQTGKWLLDSLPTGNYTLTITPPNGYSATCTLTQNFTIANTDSILVLPEIGLIHDFGFIKGYIFEDLNENCAQDSGETGLASHTVLIQPGNYLVQTDASGFFISDTLTVGFYTIFADTMNPWYATCQNGIEVYNYTFGNVDTLRNIGMSSSSECSPTSSSISETVCASYTAPDNQVYSASGVYTAVIANAQGCDSTITIDLTINSPSSSSISETVCSVYTAPDNQIYTASGVYTAVIPNAQGCDSIITIDLTISLPSSSSISKTVCSVYTAPDNQIYTTSGLYTAVIANAQGCDSTITIDLTINSPSSSSISETVCSVYTAPDNQIYTASGVYTAVIPNTQGCDSTITIDLTISLPSSSSISETVCSTYTAPDNQVYTSSGTYTAVVPNVYGCDSTISIDLTVTNLQAEVDELFPPILTASPSNAQYQWIDCNNLFAPIAGESGQEFTVSTPGSYAVIVSMNSCVDTSSCIYTNGVGLTEVQMEEILVYPNPNWGIFTLKLPENLKLVDISITDLLGRTIYDLKQVQNTATLIHMIEPSGIYYLHVYDAGKKIKTIKLATY